MNIEHNPLKYFEHLLVEGQINILMSEFIDNLTNSTPIEDVDMDSGIVKYWHTYLDEKTGEMREVLTTTSFHKYLTELLNKESCISKEKIDSYVLNNSNNYQSFLLLLGNSLQYIVDKGIDEINKHPFVVQYLLGIQNYINSKYLKDKSEQIKIDISKVKGITKSRIGKKDSTAPNISHSSNFNKEKTEYEDTFGDLSKKEVMTLEEAAYYLHISKSHLYKLTSKKIIPYHKPNGKLIYFKKIDLDTWLVSSNEPSNKEVLDNILSNIKNRKK
jgi:excisionase family DNA binding protein